MNMCFRLAMVAALLLARAGFAQVLNPDFDAGTEGWQFFFDHGAGGISNWDSVAGAPTPGSAKVGNIFIGARQDGWKQCVPVSGPSFNFDVAVASALQAGNQCQVRLDFVALAYCIDGTPIGIEYLLNNTRNDGTFETLTSAHALPPGTKAVAIFLTHVRNDGASPGDSYCHFDHVRLNPISVFASSFE
jgi:hypothetical protein